MSGRWLVSLQDKETLGEQVIRFAVFDGEEAAAVEFGRNACEHLAHHQGRGRVVPIVEKLYRQSWYRVSRFRGAVGNFDEAVKEDRQAAFSQVCAKVERTLRETGIGDDGTGMVGVLTTRLADLFLDLVR